MHRAFDSHERGEPIGTNRVSLTGRVAVFAAASRAMVSKRSKKISANIVAPLATKITEPILMCTSSILYDV